MRQKNWRIIIVGFLLIVLALGFYFFMLSIASQSTDAVTLMQTVGTVTGAVAGISVSMIIIGLIGKKV
jgi:multidrug resistance efflux pump